MLLLEVETYLKSQEYKSEFCEESEAEKNDKFRGKKEEKASEKKQCLSEFSQEEFSDDDDDVNDTYTRNKKQKETEPFTDQGENVCRSNAPFISNQRQEKDAKRRRTKWPTY